MEKYVITVDKLHQIHGMNDPVSDKEGKSRFDINVMNMKEYEKGL